MKGFQPLGNRIVIRPYKKKEQTEGGLVIPGAAQKHEGKGIVMAVSRDIADPGVIVSDHVMYNPGAARPLEIEGEQFHLVTAEEIIGTIPDPLPL